MRFLCLGFRDLGVGLDFSVRRHLREVELLLPQLFFVCGTQTMA
jgi:hypothetical protein